MFVEICEFAELFRVLDLVEGLYELICEDIYPVVEVFFHIDQRAPNLSLPNLYK